jgi:GR25 family glycosyltransferase involved in LPS biosynthesis
VFYYGLDSTKLGIHVVDSHSRQFTKIDDWVSQGAVGCALSHYSLWQSILLDNGIQFSDTIVIFEDDVDLKPGFLDTISEVFGNDDTIPSNWDLVYLGHESIEGCGFSRINDVIVESIPACTYAYAIKKRCIPLLLESVEPLSYPIDTQMRYNLKGKIKSYAFYPTIVSQRSSTLEFSNTDQFKSMTYDWGIDPYNLRRSQSETTSSH